MAFVSTSLVITTGAPQVLISSATTWANNKHASLSDPVPFVASNQSTAGVPIQVTGSSTGSSATAGLPLGVGDPISFNLVDGSPLYAFTTNSTAAVHLFAGRQ